MKLLATLRTDCANKVDCPRIVDTDGPSVVVVGNPLDDPTAIAELDLPSGETAVTIPRTLIEGPGLLDLAGLGEWIDAHHTRDAFRLEVRTAYNVTSDLDNATRYSNGDEQPNMERKQVWLDELAAMTSAGRMRRKVHVVRGRLSDYERYEFEWGFADNVTAGEDIRVLEADSRHVALYEPLGDFWVLDEEHVVRNIYDDQDRFVGGQLIDGGEAAALRALVDPLWEGAEPFLSWWERHPEEHRASWLR